MRLRRVEIRRFRKLAGPVVLDRLGDGITVIGGDNEEGKSTVLAALKAALFEVHSVGGAVREQMTPHDGGVPEVLVDEIIDAFMARFAAKVETVTTAEEAIAFKLPRELREMPAL